MFNFLKPKPFPKTENHKPTSVILKLSGLHCTSCALNIDLALEDLPSVTAKTSYVKSETKISYDPEKVTYDEIIFTIRDLGYSVN